MRSNTRAVFIKNVQIGGNNDVVIQSMCNVKTSNVELVVKQINELADLGSKLVRVSVMDMEDALAIREIVKQVNVPLVGDIHYDYKLAIAAIENGISKMQKHLDAANYAVTENGTRGQKLELIANRLMSQKTNFETLKSENEDIDITDVAIKLSSAELTYSSALMATGKVLQNNLMNFI